MKSFLLAIQFLTIVPIKIRQLKEKSLSWSMVFFPIVGLLIGLVLIGVNNLLLVLNVEQIPSGIILIVLLIILTGGIHVDGLADTADAFLSGKNKEEMLRIMRDPHIGAMGVVGIVSIILLKIAFLSSINPLFRPVSLILMCVLGRWSLVFSIFLFPYARQDGKAKVFINGINSKIFILATIIALIIVFAVWKLSGLLVFAVISLCAYLIGRFINKVIDGITGDALGAINELAEVITLVSICVLGRVSL